MVDDECRVTVLEGPTPGRTLRVSCSPPYGPCSRSVKISHQSWLPSYQKLLACTVRRAEARHTDNIRSPLFPTLSGQKLLLQRDLTSWV